MERARRKPAKSDVAIKRNTEQQQNRIHTKNKQDRNKKKMEMMMDANVMKNESKTKSIGKVRLAVLLTLATVLLATLVIGSTVKSGQGIGITILITLLWLVPSALFWIYAFRNIDAKAQPKDSESFADPDDLFDASAFNHGAAAASGDTSSWINGLY